MTRPKTKVTKKPTKKKTTESSEPNADDDLDNPDSEVQLDSLGSFFIHLIDNNHYQDDAEGSQADDAEVIILSSGSDSLPTQKIRQAVRKVTFILKKQHHEARRTTRHSGQKVTSTGLPDTPVRKRRQEVSCTSDIPCPTAGYFRYPLNPSDSNYQGTSHSSSGNSIGTKLPTLKTVPG